ncbi:MAG: NrfD/PsrC family molybdoenzyme membrane anchor subunit [Thermoplasmata archaeon]
MGDELKEDALKDEEMEKIIFRPLVSSGKGFYGMVAVLVAFVSLGLYAYYVQLSRGLEVTGMTDTVIWGLYIANFVFFIGISHAGTLISAILRLTKAEWRRPITRMAEAITVFALVVGVSMILIDMGRPDRLHHILLFGRMQSPILWDFISIATYLAGSLIYLYLPMIPDLARCKEKLEDAPRWRRKLYGWLSLNWKGTKEQKKRLERGIGIMAILIVPIAVSVHTVVSWVFAMTARAGWHSTIFGPYFVVGAIFSGIAAVIVAMAMFRKVYGLEKFIKPRHFNYLGLMLLVLCIAYMYFTVSEYLTASYVGFEAESQLLAQVFGGSYALYFWIFVIFGLLIPAFILAIPKTRTIKGTVVASILVNIGMWIKRFVITVPSLSAPQIGAEWGTYHPTWVEWSITLGAFAGFMLLFVLFSKVFPLISIWEVKEGQVESKKVSEEPTPTSAKSRAVSSQEPHRSDLSSSTSGPLKRHSRGG